MNEGRGTKEEKETKDEHLFPGGGGGERALNQEK